MTLNNFSIQKWHIISYTRPILMFQNTKKERWYKKSIKSSLDWKRFSLLLFKKKEQQSKKEICKFNFNSKKKNWWNKSKTGLCYATFVIFFSLFFIKCEMILLLCVALNFLFFWCIHFNNVWDDEFNPHGKKNIFYIYIIYEWREMKLNNKLRSKTNETIHQIDLERMFFEDI